MYGFWDNEGFWKIDHDFLIAFLYNFLSGMHGFRDNEVLLPTENEVIVLFPLVGVSHSFCWRNLVTYADITQKFKMAAVKSEIHVSAFVGLRKHDEKARWRLVTV